MVCTPAITPANLNHVPTPLSIQPVPGTLHGRWTTARVIAAGAALQLSFGLVFVGGALAPLVRAEDGWPPVLIGAVWSSGPVGYGSGIVLAGRLADRLPPRRI